MGDRAGMPAYLMQQPMIQLEGIVGNRSFLERIRRRQNILQALKDLEVDYYVVTSPRTDGNCFIVREPKQDQAGPRSPAMEGRLCSRPILNFDVSGFETDVFAVSELSKAQLATDASLMSDKK